ncbi:MAG: adenylate kinase [Planctomycetota bacterium]
MSEGASQASGAEAFRAVFLGPPGAGKGTQAKRFAEDESVEHISTGDMLRAQVQADTELGRQAKSFMDAGKLVPDDVIIAMVEAHLGREGAPSSWILDGFPRTLPQGEALDQSLKAAGRDLTHVVHFTVEEQALEQRLVGRRTCGNCGAIWNIYLRPTEKEGVCDACGSTDLKHRSDDQPEAVQKRLSVYREQTEPLLGYYRTQGSLAEVDAGAEPDAVVRQVADVLGREPA